MRTTVAAMLPLLVLAACDNHARCEQLRAELVRSIKEACPTTTPGCTGNPDLKSPRVSYSTTHLESLEHLESEGCLPPYLGPAPLFCSSGLPRCPEAYLCCGDTCRYQHCGAAQDGGG